MYTLSSSRRGLSTPPSINQSGVSWGRVEGSTKDIVEPWHVLESQQGLGEPPCALFA